jgi:Ser/Thr protein kinase RdoA (MazF antagonist)
LNDPRQVDLFDWIEGDLMGGDEGRVNTDPKWITRTYEALGALAARIHNQSSVWVPPSGFCRHVWDSDGLVGASPNWGRFWELRSLTARQRRIFVDLRNQAQRELSKCSKDPSCYSMIHADLVPENVIVERNRLRVLDFDDAGLGWHIFELATCIYFLWQQPFFADARDALLTGYSQFRSLSEGTVKQLPLFLAIRGCTYLGWLHTREGEAAIEGRTTAIVDHATTVACAYLDAPLLAV